MGTTTPQWKLRRLAPRAARIVMRRAGESAALAAHAATFGKQSDAYVAAYDRAIKYAATWKKEMEEGRGAVGALLKAMQAWLPLVARDVPGFEAGIYGDQPQVPDDVLEDGERLLAVIDEARTAQGEALAYREQATASLGPLVQAAAKEWAEAEAADKEYQTVMANLRVQAADVQRDLVALRRTLLATVGRNDKDYQKLRAERAGYADEDDDPAGPPAVQPAAQATTPAT